MKKRSLLFIGLVMMSLLAGCGQAVEIPGNGEENGNAQTGSVTKQDEREVQATNLTKQNETDICIDYSIESYGSAQSFSYKLFEQNMNETNPVLSPMSAYLALTLTGAGAQGETLEEFQVVMGEDLACIPNELMTRLPRDEEGMKIALANSAWVDSRLTPDTNWLTVADSIYKSEVYQTTLASEETMQDINTWIHQNTQGLIPQMLDKPLDEDARLALVNTIYFNGDWKQNFSANSTTQREFTKEDGTVEMVEMMQNFGENQIYVKNDIAEGVILPYADDEMVFVALKPVGDLTVRNMYEQLTLEDINGFLQTETKTLCNLRLPKFEVEFSKMLNDSLISMGLEKAFQDGEADFSGLGTLDDGRNMYIDLVFQKAVVKVDEEGTEAAAATMVIMNCESAVEYVEPPVDIYFDEPFLYMIMDKESELPLFVGIMDNPNL